MVKKVDKKPAENELKVKSSSDLKVRLISAVGLSVFIVVYIGLAIIYTETHLYLKEIAAWFNWAITLGLIGIGMYELLKVLQIGQEKRTRYLLVIGIVLAELMFIFPVEGKLNQPLYFYLSLDVWFKWYVVVLFVIIIYVGLFMIGFFDKNKNKKVKPGINALYLMLYTTIIVFGFKGFSILALAYNPILNSAIFGFNSIIFAWGIVILTDSFAYFGGRRFGKTKMAESISPKKTWEGAGIGTAIGVSVGIIYGCLFYYLLPNYAPFKAMLIGMANSTSQAVVGIMIAILAIVISLTGQIGDLLFSYLKRVFDVKDYSNLIPGHGGLLDRFDSFLFVFFILYFVILSTNGSGVL